MPSKSKKQRKFIFAKRNQYKTKANTPKKWQWIWNDEWEKIEEAISLLPISYKYIQELLFEKHVIVQGYQSPEFKPETMTQKEIEILGHTYASCRKNGGDKTYCSKVAWGAVNKYKQKTT